MNVKVIGGNNIGVTLSRRNLETLLSKLNRPGSARQLVRLTEDGIYLSIRAEHDEEHYASREVAAGPVHPLDEPKAA